MKYLRKKLQSFDSHNLYFVAVVPIMHAYARQGERRESPIHQLIYNDGGGSLQVK